MKPEKMVNEWRKSKCYSYGNLRNSDCIAVKRELITANIKIYASFGGSVLLIKKRRLLKQSWGQSEKFCDFVGSKKMYIGLDNTN